MGRKPCNNNSKDGLNKGPWTEDEDLRLTQFIEAHGEGRWPALAKNAGLKRCGKSCRFRWVNYLRPNLKHGNISPDEEDLIIRLHKLLGNRWSLIAGRIPGRTDNEIKNYWNTRSNKKAHGNACIGRLKSVRPTEADDKGPAVAVTPTLFINNQSGERDEVITYSVIPEVKKGSTSSNSINKDKTLMSPKHKTLMSPKQNPSFCSNTLWNPLQLNFIISSLWANSNLLHIDHFNVNKANGDYDEKVPAPAPPGCCTSDTVNICQDFIDQMYSVPHTYLPSPEVIPTIDEFAGFFTASWHCIKE